MEPREFHWPFSFFYSLVARFMEPGYRDLAKRMDIGDTAESLVDLGGGDGRLAIALAKMHPRLEHIVSADISQDMTRRARRRIARAGLSSIVSAECQDMQALSYGDGQFDAVVSFGALHHASQPEMVLAEAYRVLRPGGRMCVMDGYGRPSFGLIREAVRRFGGSVVSAVAYWCGSRDCLSRERISRLVSGAAPAGIEVAFDELLVTIRGMKKDGSEEVARPGTAPTC